MFRLMTGLVSVVEWEGPVEEWGPSLGEGEALRGEGEVGGGAGHLREGGAERTELRCRWWEERGLREHSREDVTKPLI